MLTQSQIDAPGRPYKAEQCPVTLGLQCQEISTIPSVYLVKVVAGREAKTVKAQEGRVMRIVGKTLLWVGGLYFAIHLLAWMVK